MKTNLLKIAGGVFFSLALLTSAQVNAQINAYENFEYPVGTSWFHVGGNGSGWAGPWDGTKVGPDAVGTPGAGYHMVIAGNLEGNIGATAAHGGQWVEAFRDLATPWPNVQGTDLWVAFTHKNNDPGKGSGGTFFWGGSENLYLGRLPNDFIGIGNCWQDAMCTGPQADAPGIVLATDAPHYYLAHITGVATSSIIHADLWVDYDGLTAPMADFNLEPTYQAGGYRSSAGGIDKVRITQDTEPIDATTKAGFFDAVRISSTFFIRPNLRLPLDLISLTAKSTPSGNLVSWTSTSSTNVKSISVLRKDATGTFVSIATLGASATSYTDTNPLGGTNYYKLSSTDNDGSSKTYDLVTMVAGFDAQASFYPNPVTNGELNVIAGKESLKSVSIFDLSGKKVAFKAVDGKSTKINTQGIAKGVYILELSGSKSTSRNKLVID